jgi:uroporphyrinogen-III decarboxylase
MQSVAELTAVALWPDLFAELLMIRARRLAVEIPAMAAAGLELNISGHDFCTERGPSISPETYRGVVMPALKTLVDTAHDHDMRYFYTGDGNIWPVAADIFDGAGVDGWLETDRSSGMELRALRERFPRVTFQGNIRSQVLHRGTTDEVEADTMQALETAHEMGGVIVGASNLIMPGTPPENITTMLRLIEDNR